MRLSLALVLTALGVATAACGGSSSSSKPPVTVTVTETPTASSPSTPPTAATSPTSQPPTSHPPTGSAPTHCLTSNLKITTRDGGAAAGTSYNDIVFTNVGSATCTLRGYPGVSWTTATHAQIGKPASEDGSAESAGPVKTVTLASGHAASAVLRQPNPENYDASSCHPTTSTYLKVYPPGETHPAYLSYKRTYCTSSDARAGVSPVQPGSHAADG